MKRFLTISITIFTLLLGFSTPMAQSESPTREQLITKIEQVYFPLFEADKTEFLALKAKLAKDPVTLKQFNSVWKDFLDTTAIIYSGVKNPNSDLEALLAYCEEEQGEFVSNIAYLKSQVAKLKTIICIKVNNSKLIIGLNPKCPAGFIKKKK
jgi:hypothetical protein